MTPTDPQRRPDDEDAAARDPRPGPSWSGRPLRLEAPPGLEALPAFAASVVESAWSVSGVHLAYHPDDLVAVDAILGSFAAAGSDAMAETVWCFGCYIGETMVRAAGGVWIDGPDAQQLGMPFAVRLPNGIDAGPIGRAFRRVDDGEGESIPYFYRVMVRSLADP